MWKFQINYNQLPLITISLNGAIFININKLQLITMNFNIST